MTTTTATATASRCQARGHIECSGASPDGLTRRCRNGDHDRCPGSWTSYPDHEGPCECSHHSGGQKTDSEKHHVVSSDTQSTLSGPSTQLTCSCGWFGHSTMWTALSHGANVPPLPQPKSAPPVPRDVLRRAIYGGQTRRTRW